MDNDNENVHCEGSGSCQFIRWDNYQSTVTSLLSTLLTKESFTDVTLVSSEGTMIHAHRVILSAFSSYFEDVLENIPCKHPTVILKDVLFEDLKAIITFIYKGEVNVKIDRFNEIYQTATILKVKGLPEKDACASKVESINFNDRCSSPVENQSSILVPQTPSPPPSPILACSSRPWMPTTEPMKSTVGNGKGSLAYTPTQNENVNTIGDTDELGSVDSGRDGCKNKTSNEHLFVIKAKKKKDAWMDPDAISSKRSHSHSQKKRYKQTSLISMALNIPSPKVDVSTLKDYKGGSRSSTQTMGHVGDKKYENDKNGFKTRNKRKSDESVEDDDKKGPETQAALDLSETFFDLSPIKGASIYARGSSPPPSKKTDYNSSKNKKSRSPLSPGKMNINQASDSKGEKAKNIKSGSTVAKSQFDSTINLLKDFDRIPEYKPVTPVNKLSRGGGKKKHQIIEEKVCICYPAAELDSVVDKKELARRKCPVHHTEEPQLIDVDTPENFWCTVQYDTQELYEKRLINVAPDPFTPMSRPRRRRISNETFADTDTENY